MRSPIVHFKIRKRNLVLVDKDAHQRETVTKWRIWLVLMVICALEIKLCIILWCGGYIRLPRIFLFTNSKALGLESICRTKFKKTKNKNKNKNKTKQTNKKKTKQNKTKQNKTKKQKKKKPFNPCQCLLERTIIHPFIYQYLVSHPLSILLIDFYIKLKEIRRKGQTWTDCVEEWYSNVTQPLWRSLSPPLCQKWHILSQI